MSELEQESYLNLLKALRGKAQNKKLGVYVVPIVPAIGLCLEFSASVGWEVGGSGSVTWQERTLTLYTYNTDKNDWALDRDRSQSLNTPSPDFSGSVYGKVSGAVGVNIICFWFTSELHIKLAATLSLKVSMPFDPAACTTLKIEFDISLKIESGLWLTAGKWEFQAASLGSVNLTLFKATLLNTHYSPQQGFHRAAVCAYTPIDYSVRFVTGVDWQPRSVCYLKEGSYFYAPFSVTALSFSAESMWGDVEEESVLKFDRISLDYEKHPDALDDKLELPEPPDSLSDSFVSWRLTEPTPLGVYYWDEALSVKQNLQAATGKSYDSQDKLPKAITLEADWGDKLHVDYDANGGAFPSGAAVGSILTKYYVPNSACEPPTVQPTKSLSRFVGWALDPLGKTPWTGEEHLTQNLRVYAQYESFDPTSQSSINAQFGSSPTVIGAGAAQNTDEIGWTLTFGGKTPDSSTLDAVLKDGVQAYENSTAGKAYIELHGELRYTAALGNIKARVSSLGTVSLTGLVDSGRRYNSFTVPSTLNGMPVAVERGLTQSLRADTVFFGATPSGDVPVNTETDKSLFQGNTYIREVYMDTTSLVKLGDDAFNGCTNLWCVTLPGTLQTIGANAFKGCGAITEAKLGLRVATVGQDAFKDCFSFSSVSVSTPYMTSMQNAFRNTSTSEHPAQIDLTLEKTVLVLPNLAFYGCDALRSLTVAEGGGLFEIGEYAFEDCGLKSAKLNEGLLTIKKRAFASTKLTEAEIPASVTSYHVPTTSNSLDENVFAQTPLKKVTIGGAGGVTKISRFMFNLYGYNACQLEEVVLREGVIKIDDYAFYTSNSDRTFWALKKVTLPDSLTEIGYAAFCNATGLETVVGGTNLQSIGYNAFYNVPALREVGAADAWRQLSFCLLPGRGGNAWLASWCQANGFRYVEEEAVTVNVRFVDGLDETGDTTLAVPLYSLLPEPDAPQREGWSFQGWYREPSEEPWRFAEDRAGATDLTLTAHWLRESANGLYAVEDGHAVLRSYALAEDESTVVALPLSWRGAPLTAIADGAFDGSGVTVLTLPEGVASIGDYALEGCAALTELRIPDSVTSIGAGALRNMTALETLTLGRAVAALGADALDGCAALKNILTASGNTHYESVDGVLYYADRAGLARYPAGAERTAYTVDASAMLIDSKAFAGARHLQTLTLPDGLVQLGERAFADSGLTALDLSGLSLLRALPSALCSGCRKLGEVLLPDGLTTVGAAAFQSCDSLAVLDVPDAVNTIGTGAFPEGVTLLAGADSAALRYADANGLARKLRGAPEIPATAVTAAKDSLRLWTGAIYTLSVTVEPIDATDKLQWYSGDSAILRVDDGVLRPLSAGETEISIVVGELELSVPVVITAEALRIEQQRQLCFESEPLHLTVSFADNVSETAVTWSSEGAAITPDGVLTPLQTCFATVTASLPNGSTATASELCVADAETLALPKGLTAVGDEAFRGMSLPTTVVLPIGLRTVGPYAFADCAGLRLVIVRDSETEIDETAFAESASVTIAAPGVSEAERFAAASDLPFEPIG